MSARPASGWRERLLANEGAQALLGVAVLLALLPLVFRMELARFAVYADWTTWRFLGFGLLVTLEVAFISIVLSLPLATLFALARLARPRVIRWPAVGAIEAIRALPILLFIYFIFRLLARARVNLSPLDFDPLFIDASAFVPVVAALTLYTTAVNGETIRSGILSLDRGQTEAARALGLSYMQQMRFIILPQAFRRVLPPLIAQFATLVKDTSLGYIVTLLELTRRGEIIYQGRFNPLETFYIIAIIYFVVNFALGQAAQWVERRISQAPGGARVPGGGRVARRQ